MAATWSDEEVVKRWLQIAQLKRGCCDQPKAPTAVRIRSEMEIVGRVEKLRLRLSCVSWFMGALCENIARRSNREDHCTGKFWESRYTCRKLVSENAILICGIYVDLNPIRAGEASVPERAIHSSVFDRILGRKQRMAAAGVGASEIPLSSESSAVPPADAWLCELTLACGPDVDVRAGVRSTTPWRASDKGILPMSLDDYLKLLDWSGRKILVDKRGSIPGDLAPILDRLTISESDITETFAEFDKKFGQTGE